MPSGFTNFLKDHELGMYYNNYTEFIHYLRKLYNKSTLTCAVDILNLAYMVKNNSPNDFMLIMCQIFTQLMVNDVKILAVFDGYERKYEKNYHKKSSYPKISYQKNNKKSVTKRFIKPVDKQIKVTKYDIGIIKQICMILNVKIITSDDEADFVCAKLYKNKDCDFVISKDMDLLILGCNILVQTCRLQHIVVFNLQDILKKYNITHSQFVDICILSDTKYVKHIPHFHKCTMVSDENKLEEKYGDVKQYDEKQKKNERQKVYYVILDLIKNHGDITQIFKHYNLKKNNKKDIIQQVIKECNTEDLVNYIVARDIYLKHSEDIIIFEEKYDYKNNDGIHYINMKLLQSFIDSLHTADNDIKRMILTNVTQINDQFKIMLLNH